MAGETSTGSLTSALPSIVAQARLIREYEGTWMLTCDVQKQTPNTGLNWTEFSLNQINKQTITETTDNRNYQTLSGQLLSTEPQLSQVIIKITDKTYRKLASVVTAKFGSLCGNAMKRGEDEDYLALFSSFGTGASPGTGNPISFGHISAAVNRARSNVTEPSNAEVFTVLHGYGIYDLQNEILAGVGTYTVQNGLTEEMYRKGFAGSVADSNVYVDGNMTVDSTPDANGATHTRDGVVACRGMAIKTEKDRDIYFGGGADVVSMVSEYSFIERTSAGSQVFAYRHLHDATAPTS